MSNKGKLNIYTCRDCGHQIVTVDRDEGTTPMMLICRRDDCDGTMFSSFYMVHPDMKPTHEWYMPKKRKWGHGAAADYHRRGGLAIRRIERKE